MLKVKIGFVPSNWEPWNGGNWAEAMRDRCVKILEQIPGLELVVPSKELTELGCVSTVEEGKRALELFRKEDIQGLLVGNMTFGMEVAVATVLSGIRRDIPVLHFCTRSGPITEQGHRTTDNWCGQFMTVSAIKRRGFNYVHINTCNPEDDYFKYKLEVFARACNAVTRFKGAKIGQLGTRPELFECQGINEGAMNKQFCQRVVPMDLAAVFSMIDAVDVNDPDVRQIRHELTEGVAVSEHTDTSLTNLARCEVAYKRIARQLDVTALAINCWTQLQDRFGVSVCSIIGRLNNQGLPTACEVDIYGAASMLAMHAAALGVEHPHFIDFTDLHPTQPNVWLAWHCGNAPMSACDRNCKPKLVKNERLLLWKPDCHGAMEFKLKNGPVTCSRLVEYDGEFTMFMGVGEVIETAPFIRGAYGWVKVNDVFDWENKMCEHGIIHHGTLIHDPKVADALELFCKFLGIKAVRGA